MPRTSSADSTLVKKAVEKLQKHPALTVPEAMQLAGFPPEQVKCRNTQRIVIRALPGKKKGDAAASSSSKCSNSVASIHVTICGSSDLSLTNCSATATATSSQQNNDSPLIAPPLTKKKRLTSKQKQDESVDNLKKKDHFKAAHKAATKLYKEEREKGDDGMTVRDVAKKLNSNSVSDHALQQSTIMLLT